MRPRAPRDAHELLDHRDWLHRLARHLVQHDEVDDAVQRTWLAALSSPPPHEHGVRRWFASLLRNGLRQEHRTSTRRRRREDVTRRDRSSRATVDVVAARELAGRVSRLLEELKEPHGSILRDIYFDGLSNRRIAARDGVSEATVRSRHHRALARLRQLLGASDGSDPRDWSLALLPVVAETSRPGRSVVALGIVASLAVKLSIILIAIALLVVALVAVLGTSESDAPSLAEGGAPPIERERDDPRRATTVERVAPDSASDDVALDAHDATATRRSDAGMEPAPESAAIGAASTLRWGRLMGLAPEVPWTSTLGLETLRSVMTVDLGLRIEVAPDGTFTIDWSAYAALDPPPEFLILRAEDPFYLADPQRFDPRSEGLREDAPVVLRVECAAVVTGIVLDENGAPVPGTGVAAYGVQDQRPRERAEGRAACDEDGRFRIKAGLAGPTTIVAYLREEAERAADTYLLPASAQADLVPGRRFALPPLILRGGQTIAGRVLWGDRSPAGGLDVRLDVADESGLSTFYTEGFDLAWDDAGAIGRRDMVTTSDAEGRFRFMGLLARRYRLQARSLTADRIAVSAREQIVVRAPDEAVQLFVAGSFLELSITAAGQPLPRANITVTLVTHGSSWTTTCTGGHVAILIEPDQIYEIRAAAAAHRSESLIFDPAAHAQPWKATLDLEPAAERHLVVELCDPEGVPLTRARIALMAHDGDPSAYDWKERSDADGLYSFADLEPGDYRLVLDPPRRSRRPEDRHWLRHESRIVVPASGDLHERIVLERGARVRIRLRDGDGVTLGGSCTLRGPGGVQPRPSFFVGDEHGWTEGGPGQLLDVGFNMPAFALAPGSWTLEIESDGHRPVTRHVNLVAGRTEELDLTLERR